MIIIPKRIPNKNYFNTYEITEDGRCYFYIVNRKGEHFTVEVDRDVLDRLIKFNRSWNAKWAGWAYYACCVEYIGTYNGKPKYKIHYLHRWIMDAKDDEYVDHIIPENTLDNRRSNLRVTTNGQNLRNRKGANKNNKSTGVRNISYSEDEDCYVVQLCKNKKHYSWRFPSNKFDEACQFVKEKRKELFGEFAGFS